MRLVGQDKEPLDVSQEKDKDVFEELLAKWSQQMANNVEKSKHSTRL